MKKGFSLRTIPLYLKILLGMIGGIVVGLVAVKLQQELFVQNWVRPWGTIFIRMLQLIAVPLVFVSLVKGITSLKEVSKLSRLGMKTLFLFLVTTIFSIAVGLGTALVVNPGHLVDPTKVADIKNKYSQTVEEKRQAAEETVQSGPLNFLVDIVPDNMVGAFSSNKKMLQVIFFAVLFSLAILLIKEEQSSPVIRLIDSLNDIMLRMVDLIISAAPYGVLALMAGLVVDFSGDISIFSALAAYAATVVFAMFFLMMVFYPALIHFFTKLSPREFVRKMYPVQMLGFTTSSSAAALPLNLETTQRELKLSPTVTSFVLPVGVTINMNGTSCYQSIAVVFIAQVLGIELHWTQLLTIVMMTTLSSIGTPGVPGGSYVILTMVLSSVGIPAEGLALILGVDRPLDMLRTSVNVTGDATVAVLLDEPEA